MVRPFIAGVVLLSGLKYVGLPLPALGVAAVLTAAIVVVMTVRATRADKPVEPVQLVLFDDGAPTTIAPMVPVPER